MVTPKWEGEYNHRVPLSSEDQGTSTEKLNPHNIWLCKLVGLLSQRTRRLRPRCSLSSICSEPQHGGSSLKSNWVIREEFHWLGLKHMLEAEESSGFPGESWVILSLGIEVLVASFFLMIVADQVLEDAVSVIVHQTS